MNYNLIITADDPSRIAEFRLYNEQGTEVAHRRTSFDLANLPISRQQGLFDLRNFVKLYVEKGNEESAIAEVGVCIAEKVLGEEIFLKLWESQSNRTVRIQLPGAAEEGNMLAAALARVPWEIARPSPTHPPLGQRNLVVRLVHDMQRTHSTPMV